MMQELNSGLIYTNTDCIGCNKCIAGCVVLGANVVVKDDQTEKYVVKVDPNRCILCGHCIEECVHGARTYKDDTDAFFEDLERGDAISVLISPTVLTTYEKVYGNLMGYLKHLGVRHLYNVSFGADLMVWAYMSFIREFGLTAVISQSCPVIVDYLEKYRPELLSHLMPIQSPEMCTAIYVSDYMKITDKLAFLSPCIAAKREIQDVNTYGKISYNVTIERFMKKLQNIDISQYYAEDENDCGLGSLMDMAGGLSKNIELYIGFDKVLVQANGHRNIFPYFDHYSKTAAANGELPFLVDTLNCANGCNLGTGVACGMEVFNEMAFSMHRSKEAAYKSGNVPKDLDYVGRIQQLDKRFTNFDLSTFVRQYDVTRGISSEVLTQEQEEAIYESMFKTTYEQRHTDCGSCGNKTCRNMVYAIGTHVNHKENCINYSKECINRETEKTNLLLAEISSMNEELKRADQLKSNFLANMSHEIRTPMNAVIGLAEMALRGDIPNEERDYIEQIKASGRSLLAIINDILDFSKIESGKMEISAGEYAVMSILNDTVNIVMTRIGEKDITLVVSADPNIPSTLLGDDIRIKQILVNLANNAIKFTKDGCVTIELSFENHGESGDLSVSVSDTGIGIKEEDLDKLFTSFQRVDSKRNRKVEGTGLGLAISKELVDLMGGTVSVKSEYGKGSTFSFTVPQKIIDYSPSVVLKKNRRILIASCIRNRCVRNGYMKAIAEFDIENIECSNESDIENAAMQGAEFLFVENGIWSPEGEFINELSEKLQVVVIVDPKKDYISNKKVRKIHQPVFCLNLAGILSNEIMSTHGSINHENPTRFEAPEAEILIVDDNAINLTVARGLLTPFHMQISVASGALEAIEMIKNRRFDIIFMDHMMPDVDGVEATHMIRALEGDYYKDLPVIALTANAINNAKEMFLREGMNDFVAKPVEMTDITAKLKKWLPQAKIQNMDTLNAAKETEEETSVSGDLLVIEGLNTREGIGLTGSEELYRHVLEDYYNVIGKKSDLIEKYEAEGNIPSYTIEVHALKSASRLIGAQKLADMAEYLEKCGHDNKLDAINECTQALLALYRSYAVILEPFGKKNEVQEETLPVEAVKALLLELYEALDDFDLDKARSAMERISACTMEEECAQLRHRLQEAVDDMEYDDAMELVREMNNTL